ncbi:MobA/MobL family protein [Streptomyces sp. ID01-9D]|nr:MobA/MobL family protein [Streptomyces sp. ID01-9D]
MKEKMFHMSIKNHSRMNRKKLKTESAVKKGAYRVGMDLVDEKTEKKYAEAGKGEREKIETVTLLTKDSSEKFHDPQYFYNEIERAEKRKDARYFKEIELSLFRELSQNENKELAMQLSKEIHQKYSLPIQVNFHKMHTSNPHCHIVIPLRPIEGEHFSNKKNRDINKREFVKESRERWNDLANQKFKQKNLNLFVDHRSYKERGIKKIPQKHIFYRHISEEHKREALEHNIFFKRYNRKSDLRCIKKKKKQEIQVIQNGRKFYRKEVRNSMENTKGMTIHKLYKNEIDSLRSRYSKRGEMLEKQKSKVSQKKGDYKKQRELFKEKKDRFKSNVFHKKMDYQELKLGRIELKGQLKETSIFDFKTRRHLKRQLIQNRVQQRRKKLEIKREKSRYSHQKNLLQDKRKELNKFRKDVFKTKLQQTKDMLKMKILSKEQSRAKNKVINPKIVSIKDYKAQYKLELKSISREITKQRGL